jgi:hypothetical protein
MVNESDILILVRKAARKKRLFLPHALRQMSRPERMIRTSEIRSVIENGEVIEDYPEDPRGHSCLIFGYGYTDRPIHVACSPKKNFLAIITAYIPDENEWSNDFKTRITL